MNRRHFLAVAALLVAGSFAPDALARDIVGDPNAYAAIAFSKSTGRYGYAYGYRSRCQAEQAAKRQCGERDAEIACWVKFGFCALALGDDKSTYGSGYSYGNGAGNLTAMNNARSACARRTTGTRVVVCISSGGEYIYTAR